MNPADTGSRRSFWRRRWNSSRWAPRPSPRAARSIRTASRPYFVERAKGSRLWDVDGNEYVDFINALAAVTLGYCDPDVDGAVRAQLEEGTIFSLPHPLETEVAEMICELVPSAEMVRFGKNGSDATSRRHPRRPRLHRPRPRACRCGYHGWQDWYIGSTARNSGVPEATRDADARASPTTTSRRSSSCSRRTGRVRRRDPGADERRRAEAGLPAGRARRSRASTAPCWCSTRPSPASASPTGGAQELFGVTPDLATFGKGLANGYPLSAVAGRADIMKRWRRSSSPSRSAASALARRRRGRDQQDTGIGSTGEINRAGTEDTRRPGNR